MAAFRGACLRGALAVAGMVAGLVAMPATAQAATTNVPCDSTALKNAIAGANSGDTLVLAHKCVYSYATPDNANNALPVITKKLTVDGRDATIQRDPTTAALFRIFEIDGPGNLALNDLTVRNGSAPGGPGGNIFVQPGGTLSLTHSVVTNGTATDGGNIFANGGGTIDLARSVVRNGTAFDGGGFFILASATVRIRHSAIHDNTSAGFGAGISSRGNLTIADNTTISDNATGGVGGGLANSGPTTIDDSKIFSNTAASTGGFRGGGGIFNLNTGTVILHHTRVEHNTVTAKANAPGMGGGISNQGVAATVVIDGGKIGHNSVEGTNAQGGGVYNEGMLNTKKLKIEHNTSAGTGAQGGGLTNNGGTATLTSSQVEHNTSSTPPGGINNRAGTVTLNDSKVKHNKPTNCAGSAVPVPGCVN
ncbi:right-handed parallel beta-helix repeat-containing protein [Streptomyces collinus]|uniref:right-handed parallel beta-helix repeat-containing protein n=1 Tax=Streptomyces collinus TaxID=42684 RepID=UPI003404C5AB